MIQAVLGDTGAVKHNWRQYPDYKNSRIEWLGEIPVHWEVRPLKHAAVINRDVLPEDTNADWVLQYIDIGNVGPSGTISSTEQVTFANAPSRARRIVHDGDTIVSTVRTYLRAIAFIQVPPKNLIVSTGFAVLQPRQALFPKYLFYMATSQPFVERIVSQSEGVSYPAITPSRLARLPVWVPPYEEQRAIVSFLDRETTKIDTLIAKRQRLISLLLEKRTALISQAVTKGLDLTVAMRDSGIEWIGAIPAHWEVRRLKDSVLGIVNGAWGEDPSGGTDDLVCVRVADFDRVRNRVVDSNLTIRSISANERRGRLLQAGDLLIEKSGGGDLQPVGAVVLYDLEIPAVCSNFIARMLVPPSCHPEFLCYLHAALYSVRINVKSIKQNTGIQNLDLDAYLNERVALPSLTEQHLIARFLNRETARIDDLIHEIRKHIELLREHRTALTTAAVTGQIDVREEVEA